MAWLCMAVFGQGAELQQQWLNVDLAVPGGDAVFAWEPACSTTSVKVTQGVETLPIYKEGNTTYLYVKAAPQQTFCRLNVVYGGAEASPEKTGVPTAHSDFAAYRWGRSWSFANRAESGITSWGNRSDDVGPLSFSNGWMQVPVTGDDPYFVYGNMFGASGSKQDLQASSEQFPILSLTLRQNVEKAAWSFFIADAEGLYFRYTFDVMGKQEQTLQFVIKEALPHFAKPTLMRAVRIDLPKKHRGMVAEIKSVRLLPRPAVVTSGPLTTEEGRRVRDQLRSMNLRVPKSCVAGEPVVASVHNVAGVRAATVRLPWVVQLQDAQGLSRSIVYAELVQGVAQIPLPLLTRAGEVSWRIGLAGDMGESVATCSGSLRVEPGAVSQYRFQEPHAFSALSHGYRHLVIEALDRYGNRCTASADPRWVLPKDVQVKSERLRFPATVQVRYPTEEPATYSLAFSAGMLVATGTLTTVRYRTNSIKLNAHGYLFDAQRNGYFPNGGLYANWPHGVPNESGVMHTAVDLFPCGPNPYRHGYPWPADVEAKVKTYLAHCASNGVNCLRLMLRNMDLVGKVDPVQLQATLHLFDLARPYGIRFNVALFEDYDKPPYVNRQILEKIVLPHYTQEELSQLPPHRARFLVKKEILSSAALRYTDADAMACQKDYLRELLPILAAREEILCYEFENEMVFPPMAWCKTMAEFMRTIDPQTLILGNPGPHEWPEPLRWRESGADLFSYHPYNDGTPHLDHGGVIYLRSKYAAQSGLPMYTGEGGLNQNRWQSGVKQVAPECVQRGVRDLIWMSVAAGANGCLYWTWMHQVEAEEYRKVPRVFAALGVSLLGFSHVKPSVSVVLPSQRRSSADEALMQRLLDLGVDVACVTTNENRQYARSLDVATVKPSEIDLPATVAKPSPGYQVATLNSHHQALLYVRNVKGGIANEGDAKRPCYLRKPVMCAARLVVVEGWSRAWIYDLDTQQVRQQEIGANRLLDLGESTHDFVVYLRKK